MTKRKGHQQVSISITQRQPGGKMLGVEISGVITSKVGTEEEIAGILLEAERHGNDGICRVHIFLK